jgi:hypothetical protein
LIRCFICDTEDAQIHFDKDKGMFTPCTQCQSIISECLEEFDNEDDVDDEDLSAEEIKSWYDQ